MKEMPDAEAKEVSDIFAQYGLAESALQAAVDAVRSTPSVWVRFMMREELGLEEPDPKRSLRSALTIGLSYIVGGLVPLAPYTLGLTVSTAFLISIAVTLLALFIFGGVKGHFTGVRALRSAVQTVLVGGVAAGAAYSLARLVSSAVGA